MKNIQTKLNMLAVAGITTAVVWFAALPARAAQETAEDVTRAPDYTTADGNDWLYNHAIGTDAAYAAKKCPNEAANDNGVDLFYVYPTLCGEEKIVIDGFRGIDDATMRTPDSWNPNTAVGAFRMSGRCFGDLAYVYAPYYRQATFEVAMDVATNGVPKGEISPTANADYCTALFNGPAYADVTNALETYFAKWNNGRKFILAGHSQGSAILRLVMEKYFTQDDAHKALLKNLVASYQIGYGFDKAWMSKVADATKVKGKGEGEDFDGVTFATDATNTGVIVSYNTFGPGGPGKVGSPEEPGNSVLVPADALAVNPLLWTTNTTPANSNLNLGAVSSYATPTTVVPGLYGAQVSARGVVECAELSESSYISPETFGTKSLHGRDYYAYWANLNRNARERIFTATGKWIQRAPDYADASGRDWLFHHDIPEKKYAGEPAGDPGVDLFYLYPTSVTRTNERAVDNICDIDDETLRSDGDAGALGSWKMSGEAFGDYTRVYAPYYRQTAVDFEVKLTRECGVTNANERIVEYWYERAPYADVTNALTYYFTEINPNGERPFVFAGHSHGSGMLRLAMERFFTNETRKAWLKNMVACYAVGFGLSPDVEKTIREKAGVPFATNATDTGVYVMWNTQGPVAAANPGILWPPNAVASVNPILWTREADVYASSNLNLGAWTAANTGEIEPGLYDASNFVANGTIVCSSPDVAGKYLPTAIGFGEKSLHEWDYKLYWDNIRANGFARVAAALGLKKVVTMDVPKAYGTDWKVEVMGNDGQWAEAVKSPEDGLYRVAASVPADSVRLTCTLAGGASRSFVNGKRETSFPMSYDPAKEVWSTTATETEIAAATKLSSVMDLIARLDPLTANVMSNFLMLADVPRPTYHEEKVSGVLFAWAEARGFEPYRDKMNNVWFDVPATPGMEAKPKVILQGHMDMVAAGFTDPENEHVMLDCDDGGSIFSMDRKTSIGADDGLGVAIALAVADGKVPHGPVRVLVTTDEEQTQTGAVAVPEELFYGWPYLINIDSETDGELTISSAASDAINVTGTVATASAAKSSAYCVRIENFRGGHSGQDIDKGRLNAILELGRVLTNAVAQGVKFELAEMTGGDARNAIPPQAQAIVTIDASAKTTLEGLVSAAQTGFRKRGETNATVALVATNGIATVLTEGARDNVLTYLTTVHDGVWNMSSEIPGLVETSMNHGLIDVTKDGVSIGGAARGSVEATLQKEEDSIQTTAKACGFGVGEERSCAPWPADLSNPLVGIFSNAWKKVTGGEMSVVATHAGLECGWFLQKAPDISVVSVGPTIRNPHTVNETTFVSSVSNGVRLISEALAAVYQRHVVKPCEIVILADGATYTYPEVYPGNGAQCEILQEGRLDGKDVTFAGNEATGDGGAIYNFYGQVKLLGSCVTFSGNVARSLGGAICNFGEIQFNAATNVFNGNRASVDGAIHNENLISLSGVVDLQTASDVWRNHGSASQPALVNWDLTDVTEPGDSVCIRNFRNYTNANEYVWQFIVVRTGQPFGEYTIATNVGDDLANRGTFILKGVDGEDEVTLVADGEGKTYDRCRYALARRGDDLVLTVGQRAPDYAEKTGYDWLFHHDIPEKKYAGEPVDDPGVDLFFLYPTAVVETNDRAVDNICDIDDEFLRSEEGALFSWEMTGEVFGDFTRVYVPYYRQTPLDFEITAAWNEDEGGVPTACDRAVEYWYNHAPYADVTNALTYYFTEINPNGERPFVLAGHSHGSGMLRLAMERFFTNETRKAWLKNMVACYAVGFGLSPDVEETIREKAGVPFATNATDTGVYVMWNTQGAGATPGSPAALWPSNAVASINPLTWSREADAYASSNLNLGAWTAANTGEIEPGLYDASNFVANGTIICSSPDLTNRYIDAFWGFGENSLHRWDYKAYWENVRANALLRYQTWKEKQGETVRIRFAKTVCEVVEGGAVKVCVRGGSLTAAVQATVTYQKNTGAYSAAYADGKKVSFPLTLSWAKGDVSAKEILFQTAATSRIEEDRFFTLQLGSAVGEDVFEGGGVCTVTIKDAWTGTGTSYVRALAWPADGGTVSGSGTLANERSYRTLAATTRNGSTFVGWFRAKKGNAQVIDLNAPVEPYSARNPKQIRVGYGTDNAAGTYFAYYTNVLGVAAVVEPTPFDAKGRATEGVAGVTGWDGFGTYSTMVGVKFALPVDFADDSGRGRLAVTKLPNGLSYNAKTGCISGVPTKAGTYASQFVASNAAGRHTVTYTFVVEEIPTVAVGTFAGVISDVTNRTGVGSVQFTAGKTGSLSAKVMRRLSATRSFSAKGFDYIDANTLGIAMTNAFGEVFEAKLATTNGWYDTAVAGSAFGGTKKGTLGYNDEDDGTFTAVRNAFSNADKTAEESAAAQQGLAAFLGDYAETLYATNGVDAVGTVRYRVNAQGSVYASARLDAAWDGSKKVAAKTFSGTVTAGFTSDDFGECGRVTAALRSGSSLWSTDVLLDYSTRDVVGWARYIRPNAEDKEEVVDGDEEVGELGRGEPDCFRWRLHD